MKSTQKGFTLIELMIVIAIIAILAAIAVPAYQTYITKSQFTEAMTVANGIETNVSLYWTQNGACPTLGTTPGFPDAAGDYKGKYVASASIAAGDAATNPTCNIEIKFNDSGVSEDLQSATVTFKGSQDGGNFQWQCNTSVKDKFLPEACRG